MHQKDGISDFVENADCIAVLFILFTLGIVMNIAQMTPPKFALRACAGNSLEQRP